MTMWTRTVCLKTDAVLQTVLKDHNYVMRLVCFQELHIMSERWKFWKRGEMFDESKSKEQLNCVLDHIH